MKIALISESPSVTTGFGVNAGHLVKLLAEQQQDVVCFGVCALGQPLDPAHYPCRIVPMPRDQREAIEFLPAFLQEEQPDLLFIHYDLAAVCRFVDASRAASWRGPIISHFVIDGIPFDTEYLDTLRTLQAGMTPTYTAARYIASQGIKHVIAAPHPVNPELFRPLLEREALRKAAGLEGRFVVGVFGRNVERKQQPRVMMAIEQLKQAGKADHMLLYLHCQPTKEDPWLNSWNLPDIARQLGIEDQVLFPQASFRQLAGIPYQAQGRKLEGVEQSGKPSFPAEYTYVERLNCCDMVVNAPYGGAFELASLESQSCGVPVAVTNDRGAIAEVVGDSAILLEPADIGIHSSGARQYFVGAATIAEAILAVKEDPALRAELIRKGHANAARYTIEPLRQAVAQALAIVRAV